MAEDRAQMTDGRGQMTEDGIQKAEDRIRKPANQGNRVQVSRVTGDQDARYRGQTTEDRRQNRQTRKADS